MTRKTDTIEVPAASWAVDMTRVVELDSAYYGHQRVLAGRFTLADPVLAEQARALLPVPVGV